MTRSHGFQVKDVLGKAANKRGDNWRAPDEGYQAFAAAAAAEAEAARAAKAAEEQVAAAKAAEEAAAKAAEEADAQQSAHEEEDRMHARTMCFDRDANCAQWAAAGECEANEAFMATKCRKACGKCGGV